MEYASVVTKQHDDLTLLYRYLENILSQESKAYENLGSKDLNKIQAKRVSKTFSN